MKLHYKFCVILYVITWLTLTCTMDDLHNFHSIKSLNMLALNACIKKFQSMIAIMPDAKQRMTQELCIFPHDLQERLAAAFAQKIYERLSTLVKPEADAVKASIEQNMGILPDFLAQLIREKISKEYASSLGDEILDYRFPFLFIFYNGKIGDNFVLQEQGENWQGLEFYELLNLYVERTKQSYYRSRSRP